MHRPPRPTIQPAAGHTDPVFLNWQGYGVWHAGDRAPAFPDLCMAAWGLHANPAANQFSLPGHFDMWRLESGAVEPRLMIPNMTGELLPPAGIPYADLPETVPFLDPPAGSGPKTILFVFRNQAIGGDHRYHVSLMREFRGAGYRVMALALRDGSREFEEEIRSAADELFVAGRFLPLNWHPVFYSWLIAQYKIESVISTDSPIFLRMLAYVRSCHPDVVFADIAHLVEPDVSSGGHTRWTLMYESQLDLVLTESGVVRDWLGRHGMNLARVHRLGPVLDTHWWAPERGDGGRMRGRFEMTGEALHLVFHGRLERVKRPGLLVEVFKRLYTRHPHLRLTLAGSGTEEDNLRAQIEREGLGEVVCMCGPLHVDAVRDLLASADIMVLPSVNEGLSLAVVEAMAMEVVVVAGDVGGHSELVTPECGILVPRGEDDRDAYTATLERLVTDAGERDRLRRNARRAVVHQCDLGRAARKLMDLLDEAALAANRPHPIAASLARSIASDAVERMRGRCRTKTDGRKKPMVHSMLQRRLHGLRSPDPS